MATEQVELASVPYLTFIANKKQSGEPASYSFVLRGYVRHWLGNVWAEYDRIKLTELVAQRDRWPPRPRRCRPRGSVGEAIAVARRQRAWRRPRVRSSAGRDGLGDASAPCRRPTATELSGRPRASCRATRLRRRRRRGERTPVFIVASPRPQVGKTFLARLLTDFLRLDGGEPVAFDLNPSGDALAETCPAWRPAPTSSDIRRQMALFDCLIVEDGIAKVIDLGHGSFARFFSGRRGDRLHRRGLRGARSSRSSCSRPIRTRSRCKAYADLQRRFPKAVLVPVFNEAILKGRKLRDQFPVGPRRRGAAADPAACADPEGASGQVGAFLCRLPCPDCPTASRAGSPSSCTHGPGAPSSSSASSSCGCCSKSCARRSPGVRL